MTKVVAINGSPRKGKGNTALILQPLLEGMQEAGADSKLYYAVDLKVRSCNCVDMYCWFNRPGECCHKDDMELLYSEIRSAEILILATPVYIPLPGEMQAVVNRLCPLMIPELKFEEGRTRARFRDDVHVKKLVLVASGGWWELGNFGTVVRIVEELAADAAVDFAGALLRPHAGVMRPTGELTPDGLEVQKAARTAGRELIESGAFRTETLEAVSRPLVPEPQYRGYLNQLIGFSG